MVKRLSPRRICFSLAVDSIFQRDRRLGDFDKRYVYMLIDDVANAIVPFQNAPNVDFRATLTTSPIEADSLVRGGFGDPARYDFDETVADFIRDSAKAVLYFGREFYYVHSPERNAPCFAIGRADPVLLHEQWCRFGRRSRQHRPRLDLKSACESDWVEVRLPMPVKRVYPRTVRTLARLSGAVLPNFTTEIQGTRATHFDIAHYKSVEIRTLLKATKEIGWNIRGRVSGEVLEYYVLERFLRFEEFKARLREHILNGLNEIIGIAGEKERFSAKLELEGIASPSDIARARDDLQTGSKPFREVIQPFLWY